MEVVFELIGKGWVELSVTGMLVTGLVAVRKVVVGKAVVR